MPLIVRLSVISLVVIVVTAADRTVPNTEVDVPNADARECLAALVGTWRGPGTVLGRTIVMEQIFAPALMGRYTEQRMRHLATDTSSRASFEGRGFYRPSGAAAPDSITGTWMDARGVSFVLRGDCASGTLSSHWSGPTESGRTIYTLRDGALEVIDSVFPATAPAREFGRSTLRRP